MDGARTGRDSLATTKGEFSVYSPSVTSRMHSTPAHAGLRAKEVRMQLSPSSLPSRTSAFTRAARQLRPFALCASGALRRSMDPKYMAVYIPDQQRAEKIQTMTYFKIGRAHV